MIPVSLFFFFLPYSIDSLFSPGLMVWLVFQVKSSKKEEKCKDGEKKRKKRGVIESGKNDTRFMIPPEELCSCCSSSSVSFSPLFNLWFFSSDSSEEEPVRKSKKSPKGKVKSSKAAPPPKKDPVQYVSETDSDSDNFQSLKKVSQTKKDNTSKQTKSQAEGARLGPKPPVKSSTTQVKTGLKSPPALITPKKVTPPQPKHTPTSVLDYFGGGTIQRSDKKLVASTKRKAPTQDTDDLISDEEIARQLQMDQDMEMEKQVHEDEEFARTLALLDEEPQAKKARKGSDEKQAPAVIPKKSCTDSAAGSTSSLSKTNRSVLEDVYTLKPWKEQVTFSSVSQSKQSTSTSPDDAEKKKVNSAAFRNFLNRDGPRALAADHHLGPSCRDGAENCLEGCVFVLTGVLESMERDDAKSLIERYGGKVTGNVSKKTTYMVQGRDSGVSKIEKAESFGTKILDEDALLELIRTKPGKKSKYEIAAEAEVSKGNSRSPHTPSPSKTGLGQGHGSRTTPSGRGSGHKTRRELGLSSSRSPSAPEPSPRSRTAEDASLLWVDKYRPRSLKTVIGQQGDQSCANKLLRWLQSWHKSHSATTPKATAKFGKFGGGKDDGSSFKAALLSGPPGVGKTTTAALVCEELGFSYVEMNASCTRSQKNLKQVVAESLNNTSIEDFYKGTSQTVSNKHVLIMDEVDGMAGNEDRGGIQEMIGLIRSSKIPIICMCNDRNHQKIRSLANYCFDLRFQRPRVEQIKGAMMSLAFKEGIKIPPPALNEIILASNQDVRQVIHNLSMWSAKDKVMTYDQCKSDAASARKDMKLGPFDVCRKVFVSGEDTSHMSLIDKSDLFFHDYSLAPLFVQENYLHVRPAAAGGDLKSHLVLLSKTADSISDGDLVDRQIRSRQNWSLLPTQAIYASVLPGELMRGYMSQFPTFPSWLGKNSSTSKHSRIVQELASHMSLKTLSSRQAVNLDYLHYLRQALLSPLQRLGAEGASQAVQLLDNYHLIKEDVDSIMEISVWGGQADPYSKLDSKVKAAFTRAYNKEVHLTPYSLQTVKKGRRGGAGGESEQGGEDVDNGQQESEDEGEGLKADAMIKVIQTAIIVCKLHAFDFEKSTQSK
uniref:Replication factor C subunit 1 n=1 Tax=Scophthalmus maximus TaxID=52904 RepID=A0A8D3E4D7_SCOMX